MIKKILFEEKIIQIHMVLLTFRKEFTAALWSKIKELVQFITNTFDANNCVVIAIEIISRVFN
jgi:hypothetical protein